MGSDSNEQDALYKTGILQLLYQYVLWILVLVSKLEKCSKLARLTEKQCFLPKIQKSSP